ncbi:hypothetical protein FE782_25385 [Paenibacillus antri]|uniref:Uncharacterized protein n=1 Tax=Paenibacillus antri TaxID=2582848 RepID=A0A5R9G5P7_9BACL|nr:hypothetical protein [Paenibacillus antri]TLS49450.1 hypothetical protein FE782_25385 [Paenibacillus antri]
MFEALLPGAGAWIDGAPGLLRQWFWWIAAAAILYGAWRSHWRSRYVRLMRRTFEATNLFVKPRKDKMFPQLISLSATEDDLYYVFRYRLRPGMTVPQFEEKKKFFEATFHAEAKGFGKAGIVTIKVKKQKRPVPPTSSEQSA